TSTALRSGPRRRSGLASGTSSVDASAARSSRSRNARRSSSEPLSAGSARQPRAELTQLRPQLVGANDPEVRTEAREEAGSPFERVGTHLQPGAVAVRRQLGD